MEKRKQIGIRLAPDFIARLKKEAAKDGRTVTNLVEFIINQFYEKAKKGKSDKIS